MHATVSSIIRQGMEGSLGGMIGHFLAGATAFVISYPKSVFGSEAGGPNVGGNARTDKADSFRAGNLWGSRF